jgi:hypothetical protein
MALIAVVMMDILTKLYRVYVCVGLQQGNKCAIPEVRTEPVQWRFS